MRKGASSTGSSSSKHLPLAQQIGLCDSRCDLPGIAARAQALVRHTAIRGAPASTCSHASHIMAAGRGGEAADEELMLRHQPQFVHQHADRRDSSSGTTVHNASRALYDDTQCRVSTARPYRTHQHAGEEGGSMRRLKGPRSSRSLRSIVGVESAQGEARWLSGPDRRICLRFTHIADVSGDENKSCPAR